MMIMRRLHIERSAVAPLWATALNILLVYVVYSLLRVEYLLENWQYFRATAAEGNLWQLLAAGPVFDTPGIFYTNALYVLMMLLPLHLKECPGYYRVCRWVYMIVNGIAVVMNLGDSVYFSYTLRRTTWDVTHEFANDSNLLKIIGVEMLHHWYLVVLAIVLLWGMWRLYSSPSPGANTRPRWRYYLLGTLSLALGALTVVTGIRGGMLNHWYNYVLALPAAYACVRLWRRDSRKGAFVTGAAAVILLVTAPIGGWRHRDIRPIALSNAGKYTSRPIENALVLNTPFAVIRTIGSSPYRHPGYYVDEAQLEAVYTPVHTPQPEAVPSGKNIVVIILESFGREYIGSLNHEILGDDYKGYTPFIDSLVSVSATWRHSFDNGRKSIDGMPSILAGIPQFVRPFVLTPAAMNHIEGLPALLKKNGYETAFFHGARTGSMGFDGFARSIGFDNYYGREDFEREELAGGAEEFDGYWAIWDEPFLQYYALKMSQMQQPFMTALFSASSHHPFHIPERYTDIYPEEGGMPIFKTIRYTDNALRRFFETASRQDWFKNTIFVITNDHTNMRAHDEYRSDIGAFYGPVIIYDPSGEITPGQREGIAQQTDIMPTLLNHVGYKDGYVAFGIDLLNTPAEETWAVSYINDTYQYVRYGLVMQWDGEKVRGVYRLGDHLMADNLIGRMDGEQTEAVRKMEAELKAIVQQYMDRMLDDRLTAAGH